VDWFKKKILEKTGKIPVEFEYLEEGKALIECPAKNNGTKIGSIGCCDCPFFIKRDLKNKIVWCQNKKFLEIDDGLV